MAKNFQRLVGREHFAAEAHVHEGTRRQNSLASIVRNMLQHLAGAAVSAATITGLTDSSGGTAPAQYAFSAGGRFVPTDLTGLTTGVQAAALNTAADLFSNAYREIAADLNLALAALSSSIGTVAIGPGGATNDTIEALTVAITANTDDTNAATAASCNAVREDLLHHQLMLINAIDDVREMVGLSRKLPFGPGRVVVGASETFVFAAGQTITRDVGNWATDGFVVGDEVTIQGTTSNNRTVTITVLTATVLTHAGTAFTGETITNAEANANGFAIFGVKRNFPGKLAGADAGPDLSGGSADPAGADWTLSFITGTSAISDAANVNPPTAAALKTAVDAWLAQMRHNVALMADMTDEITQLAAAPLLGYVGGGR